MKTDRGYIIFIVISLSILSVLFALAINSEVRKGQKENAEYTDIKINKENVRIVGHDSWSPTPVYSVEIDGCEYFMTIVHGGITLCHKGNCKNPIHRR